MEILKETLGNPGHIESRQRGGSWKDWAAWQGKRAAQTSACVNWSDVAVQMSAPILAGVLLAAPRRGIGAERGKWASSSLCRRNRKPRIRVLISPTERDYRRFT